MAEYPISQESSPSLSVLPRLDIKILVTEEVLLYQNEIENGKSFAELAAEEFLFVPVGQNSGSVAVQLEATSGTIVAEYAYFTKG